MLETILLVYHHGDFIYNENMCGGSIIAVMIQLEDQKGITDELIGQLVQVTFCVNDY